MKVWPESLAVLFLVAGACGSGDSVRPAATEVSSSTATPTTLPATTVPTTIIPTTIIPTTILPATTVPVTTAGTDHPMTVDELAALLPTVGGYEYAEIKQTSVWGFDDSEGHGAADDLEPVKQVRLQDLATTVTRPVYVDGGDPEIELGWVGEVSVFDAGADTPQLWMDFVDYHRMFCLTAPSMSDGFYVSNTVPGKWQGIGNEIVMTGVAEPDGDIGAAWFHGGLIWAVSGWSSSSEYVEGLIAEQEATGVEPEQIDVDALEGALANVIVDVPGFEFIDPEPADVLWMLEGMGNCVQHLSLHRTHPTGQADLSMEVYMAGWADPSPCDRGAWIIDKEVGDGGTRRDTNGVPAVISADGEQVMIVAGTGVYVSSIVSNADDLQAFAPVLEMLADTASATEI